MYKRYSYIDIGVTENDLKTPKKIEELFRWTLDTSGLINPVVNVRQEKQAGRLVFRVHCWVEDHCANDPHESDGSWVSECLDPFLGQFSDPLDPRVFWEWLQVVFNQINELKGFTFGINNVDNYVEYGARFSCTISTPFMVDCEDDPDAYYVFIESELKRRGYDNIGRNYGIDVAIQEDTDIGYHVVRLVDSGSCDNYFGISSDYIIDVSHLNKDQILDYLSYLDNSNSDFSQAIDSEYDKRKTLVYLTISEHIQLGKSLIPDAFVNDIIEILPDEVDRNDKIAKVLANRANAKFV